VALAWLMQKAEVSAPIIGVTKPQHLEDAVAALELTLEREEIERLERDYVPHAVAGAL
jgi:aryl-alcohol dehydrogenase-like predicted oxidoreductase